MFAAVSGDPRFAYSGGRPASISALDRAIAFSLMPLSTQTNQDFTTSSPLIFISLSVTNRSRGGYRASRRASVTTIPPRARLRSAIVKWCGGSLVQAKRVVTSVAIGLLFVCIGQRGERFPQSRVDSEKRVEVRDAQAREDAPLRSSEQDLPSGC